MGKLSEDMKSVIWEGRQEIPEGWQTVRQLSEEEGTSDATTRRHLSILVDAGKWEAMRVVAQCGHAGNRAVWVFRRVPSPEKG